MLQVFFSLQQMEVLGTRTWLDGFSRFVIYLRHLMTEAKTASPLESAIHSISWFHQLGGEPSPSDHPLVRSTLASAQRFLARQTIKKVSVTVFQLEQLVASKTDSMASLYNIRSVVNF